MTLTYIHRIGLVCLTAVCTGAVFHVTRPPVPDSQMRKAWFWSKKTHDTEEATFIFYGDSRINQGIDTRKFQPYFPDHVFKNFGYQSAGFNPEMYAHLRRILRGKPDPILVLGLSPHALTALTLDNEQYLEEKTRSPDVVRTRLHLYPWLLLFEPVRPSQDVNADRKKGRYATYHPGGWKETYGLPEDPGAWLPKYRLFFQEAQVRDDLVRELFAFVREMTDAGVRVAVFRVPTTVQMEELEDRMSGFDEEAVARGIQEAGGVWITHADRFAYYSYDGSHLHFKAARSFSGHLAKKLAARFNREP